MSSEKASSSFPSSTSKWNYNVFLSFRGKDTRRGFTNYLYNSLVDQGINTFMDDELQKGKPISPELLAAIEESNFALIVLSPNYASSPWCLDELLKILECMEARKTIFPIFYGVDPANVRRQTGSFAKAFAIHEERFVDDTEKVQRWRAALTKVSNFSGWNSKDWGDPELLCLRLFLCPLLCRSQALPSLSHLGSKLAPSSMASLCRYHHHDLVVYGLYFVSAAQREEERRIEDERNIEDGEERPATPKLQPFSCTSTPEPEHPSPIAADRRPVHHSAARYSWHPKHAAALLVVYSVCRRQKLPITCNHHQFHFNPSPITANPDDWLDWVGSMLAVIDGSFDCDVNLQELTRKPGGSELNPS